uniref:Uncharacterized protein n=1 Tax=Esox lucius TaxID=8010 RepID=A0AAY5K5T4_ESOLU
MSGNNKGSHNPTTSQKHRNFVSEPMGNRSVRDVPGIGPVQGRRLEESGKPRQGPGPVSEESEGDLGGQRQAAERRPPRNERMGRQQHIDQKSHQKLLYILTLFFLFLLHSDYINFTFQSFSIYNIQTDVYLVCSS